MGYVRRVTLRCLCDDLTDDWERVAEQRGFQRLRHVVLSDCPDSDVVLALDDVPTTALAAHPLVGSLFEAFKSESAEVRRESISGLTGPHWWKQKISRWRGAATDADLVGVGEAWLCAGGLRAAGDSRDFYRQFMAAIQGRGPEQYLPASEDRRLQEIEAKVARREAWLDQLRLAVLVCVSEAAEVGGSMLHVPAPGADLERQPITHLTIEIHREGDGPDELIELFIHVSQQDHARPNLAQLAVSTALAVVEPTLDDWRVLPGAGADQIWSALVSPDVLRIAQGARAEGEVPAHLRSACLRLGVQAHYTRKHGIVSATVEGDAVRGLCGRWFVPTANPELLQVCPVCEGRYATLAD